MKKVMLVLAVALFLTGCGAEKPEQLPTFEPAEFSMLDGSTATLPLSKALAGAGIEVIHNQTHNAIINVIESKKEIALVTHPSESELKAAENAGVELEIVPVVNEAFVFLLSKDNPVNSLTSQQIRDIYSGKITNWKEVGGEDLPIKAYQRNEGSGSQSGMMQFMGETKLTTPPKELISGEMGGLLERIADVGMENRADAIGYSYYFYVNNMYVLDTIKLLAIDEMSPTPETIAAKQYPITTQYYAVLRKDATEDSFARRFLKLALSKTGQKIAEEAGYVKL